jgi:formate-dependent nitrite reductase membrane component NrfD
LLGLAIIGSGLGPILVALLTDFVFQDQAAIGKSICIVAIASMVAGWLLLRMSLKPIRDVITQSEGALVSATE